MWVKNPVECMAIGKYNVTIVYFKKTPVKSLVIIIFFFNSMGVQVSKTATINK